MKPEPKPGDRVRLTMEGVATEVDDGGFLTVQLDGGCPETDFTPAELSAPTFKIEILEAPIAVGDRVVDDGGNIIEVIALHGEYAWGTHDTGLYVTRPVPLLKRIEPSHED
jgi:hypothetical protein